MTPEIVAIRTGDNSLFSVASGRFYLSSIGIRNSLRPVSPEWGPPNKSNLECSQNPRRKQAIDMEWGKSTLETGELRGEKNDQLPMGIARSTGRIVCATRIFIVGFAA
jgi:hypothetical protein